MHTLLNQNINQPFLIATQTEILFKFMYDRIISIFEICVSCEWEISVDPRRESCTNKMYCATPFTE